MNDERVNRCESQMWAVGLQAAALGVPVMVDCGLTQEAHRSKWAHLAAEAGLRVRLHHVDVAAEEQWLRVQRHNAERGVTFRLEVTREMFNFVETLWETPTDAELRRLNGTRVTGE